MACGGSSGSTSNASPKASPTPTKAKQITAVDACTLVSASDASAAVGTTLTALPTGAGAAAQSICIYSSQSGSQAGVFVFAEVYSDTSAADQVQPDQIAAALNGQFGVTNSKAVTGIGDKAFEYTATSAEGSGIAIFVFKGNVVLMIVVSPATNASKVEAIARTAVGNLDKASS